jgi:hypothetical protein
METSEGAVIPSNFEAANPRGHAYNRTIDDYCIRLGRIVKAYAPTDDKSSSKKFIEYDVMVSYSHQGGPQIQTVYPRCTVASLFGGVADYVRWTPRVDNFDDNTQIGFGSRVLLLCINGNTRFAYIVGGIPNPDTTQVDGVFDNNHHFKFEFNGVAAYIDPDGGLSLVRRGQTDVKGKLLDTANGGATFSLTSDGEIVLGFTKVASENASPVSAILNKSANSMDLFGTHLETSFSDTQVWSGSFTINGGQQQFVNGTTYRTNENVLNTTMSTAHTTLAGLLTTAGAALTAAAPLMLIPIVGPMIASPFVLTAGIALTSAAASVTTMATAETTFESSGSLYLSNTNKFDDSNSGPNPQPVKLEASGQQVVANDQNG